jgi:hypothetical protein
MAKKRKKRQVAVAPVTGVPAVGLPFGGFPPFVPHFGLGMLPQPQIALEQRSFTQVKVAAGEYKLDDGTTLTVKPVLVDVKRIKDQWGPDGKPSYALVLTKR